MTIEKLNIKFSRDEGGAKTTMEQIYDKVNEIVDFLNENNDVKTDQNLRNQITEGLTKISNTVQEVKDTISKEESE
ncbi:MULTISPECIES: hypothetical protein [Bacillus]|uniref:hypothetical protein n=1 Tax=Bacillus TaxID=1386 RepID=UPI000CF04CBB|nr:MULTISPECIES: hypothetical protein [Bacillus]MCM3278200.1 hypothetical protein [Bacillus velezensis]MCM3351320.1 hypothetical protein [Bacillus velezensis]MCW8785917.1 hypothetical protein [Bacillus velezensis]PQB11529.1 hypothetical protein C5O26_10495 [Bacillus velezensis]QHJ03712.1 hypothetical protein GNE05_10825 [Bacillus sp. AM1(2019)]